jgi:hypothetical protein
MKTIYKHTQMGYLIIIVFFITILILSLTILQTGLDSMALSLLAVLALAGILFSSLTVVVTEEQVSLHFTFGLIRTSFSLKDIKSVSVVRNPWYYGWGIHFITRGCVFNVSGTSAVELEMLNGKRYRIGSDDAAELTKAISTALRADSSIHSSLD